MHDLIFKRYSASLLKGASLLCLLLFSLGNAPAFALIQNNLSCLPTNAFGAVQLGDFAPSTAFTFDMTANCTVTRWYPKGASLQHSQFYSKGSGNKVRVVHMNSNQEIPEAPIGTPTTVCMPSYCEELKVGRTFTYRVRISGMTSAKPGNYALQVSLTDTSIQGWQNYGDYLQHVTLNYQVIQPACAMGSAGNLNLPFGTLNSNDFDSAQKIANITMNCIRGTDATATLVPTQNVVSGSPGVSATTLEGLSMAVTWADTNAAVMFNIPHALSLKTGTNDIRLGFRPRLNTSVSPTGNFSSQYTFNIMYR